MDKPFFSADAVREIVDACQANDVAFLDGTHFVHSKRLSLVQKAAHDLDSTTSHPIKRVVTSFSHVLKLENPNEIRADPSLEPIGALGDLGWYNCRLAVSLLGVETCSKISNVSCHIQRHTKLTSVIVSATGIVTFNDGATLLFDCDGNGPCRQSFEAVTQTGTICVRDFVLPEGRSMAWKPIRPTNVDAVELEAGFEVTRTFTIDENGNKQVIWPDRQHVPVAEGCMQAESMVRAFVKLCNDKNRAERKQWADESIATQALLDALVASEKKASAALVH